MQDCGTWTQIVDSSLHQRNPFPKSETSNSLINALYFGCSSADNRGVRAFGGVLGFLRLVGFSMEPGQVCLFIPKWNMEKQKNTNFFKPIAAKPPKLTRNLTLVFFQFPILKPIPHLPIFRSFAKPKISKFPQLVGWTSKGSKGSLPIWKTHGGHVNQTPAIPKIHQQITPFFPVDGWGSHQLIWRFILF